MSMLSDDESIGVNCPGCGTALTISNAGGYRCYCEKCVMAMPPLPKVRNSIEHKGFYLSGLYPNFKWISAD